MGVRAVSHPTCGPWPLAVLLALLPGPTSTAAPQQREPRAASGRILGAVIQADSGRPIRQAVVRVESASTDRWEAVTDPDGRFEVQGLPEGQFSVSAQKAGFVLMVDARNAPEPTRTVRLTEGGTADAVTLRLLRGSAINGRVVDEFGDPLVETSVRALRLEYGPGGRRVVARQSVQTNDLGQFRLYGLTPGTYFVSATQSSGDTAVDEVRTGGPPARGGSGFARTYYPGTAASSAAQAIIVRPGDDVVGADFALTAVRLARVSGTVLDSRNNPAPGYGVLLSPANSNGAHFADLRTAETDAGGRFAFSQVAPDDYRVDVVARRGIEAVGRAGGLPGQSQAADAPEFATARLSVTGEDVEGLSIRTTAGRRLAGRIRAQGATLTPQQMRQVRVTVFDPSPGQGMLATWRTATTFVAADGSFEVRGTSGTSLLRVFGLPQGWLLHAVLASGVDVADRGVDSGDPDLSDLDVVVTPSGRIAGRVTDERGNPVANAAVLLFPEQPARWALPENRYINNTQSGADGTFRVSNLPAGDYLAVVLSELADGQWAEPGFLEQLAPTATRVHLSDGVVTAVLLRVGAVQ